MKFDVRSLEKHRLEPKKTLDEYAKDLRVQLGENIKNCQKIYLDTNYWLELRDVILQRQKNIKFVYLLELLRNGAEAGKLICPISDENFYEILQQSDQKTLSASTILIDELSRGISLISAEERIRLEILYFVNRNVYGEASVYPHDTLVWSKVSYIFGMMHPSFSALPTKEELIFQKSFLDHMWSISFSEMIEVIGMENILTMPKFRDISKEINENKIKYAHQNNSFKQLFLSEVAGVVDLYRPLFEEALAYLYEKETGQKPSADEIKIANPGKAANSIYQLFKKNKLGDFFPTLIIGAGLHASVRHDLKKKFKSNDMSDFRHAQAALPYYNCFFTEHSLRDLVTRKNIRFDSKYNCDVSSDPSDALQSVEKICS